MTDSTETDPTITANITYDAAPAYDEIITTAQKLVTQSLEAAALVKATREKLAMYEHDAETLGRVKDVLRAARKPVDDPPETVRVLCESENELSAGANIIRQMMAGMGFNTGSIPERLKAIEAALELRKKSQQIMSSMPNSRFEWDGRTDLILDCLGVPRQDKSGTMLEDGRVMWLAGQAGYDMSDFPPHILEFSRQCNVGTNKVSDLRAALVELLRKRTPPPSTEPKTAPAKKVA